METCSACKAQTAFCSWNHEHILCRVCQRIAQDMGFDLTERISPANLDAIAAMQPEYFAEEYRVAC